jgi:PAS domain S-box-containing protein
MEDRQTCEAEDITARKQAEETLQEINSALIERVREHAAELQIANARLAEEAEHRRRVETELRKSEEKYRTLVESAGEAIAVVNDAGVFLFMNETAATRLGGRPEDLTGKSMWDLFPKAIADRQAESVREAIRTGQGTNIVLQVELRRQRRWYNTTVEPIRDAGGNPQVALVIARDIHDLVQARHELEQYQRHISRAEHLASVGTLSATVAHELAQPLTVVRLSIQSALAQLKDAGCPPAALEALHDSLDGVSDVVSRVERFRNYARQPTQTNPSRVRPQDVIERTLRLLEDKARTRKVSLGTEGIDALPLVYADVKDLEQMCFALIENAIQAADGRKSRSLTIRGRAENQQILLTFEDTCGGIPTENLDKIFQPFFTTKGFGEGTGLGLCIVETVVSRLGGKVHVETIPGRGSTFRITLPGAGS